MALLDFVSVDVAIVSGSNLVNPCTLFIHTLFSSTKRADVKMSVHPTEPTPPLALPASPNHRLGDGTVVWTQVLSHHTRCSHVTDQIMPLCMREHLKSLHQFPLQDPPPAKRPVFFSARKNEKSGSHTQNWRSQPGVTAIANHILMWSAWSRQNPYQHGDPTGTGRKPERRCKPTCTSTSGATRTGRSPSRPSAHDGPWLWQGVRGSGWFPATTYTPLQLPGPPGVFARVGQTVPDNGALSSAGAASRAAPSTSAQRGLRGGGHWYRVDGHTGKHGWTRAEGATSGGGAGVWRTCASSVVCLAVGQQMKRALARGTL